MNNDNLLWSDFAAFPSPLQKEYLHAPFGAGVYELKNAKTNELVYVGEGANTAYRMSSLLLESQGAGTRTNSRLRNYIFENINDVHYRTLVCTDKTTAKQIQNKMIATNKYLFN